MRSDKKLKIGLLLNSRFSSKYIYQLAEWGQSCNDLSVAHLIIQDEPLPPGPPDKAASSLSMRGVEDSVGRKSFMAIGRAEGVCLRFFRRHKDHERIFDLSKLGIASTRIRPENSGPGPAYAYSGEEAEKIRALGLDVLIHCGSGTLRGEILKIPRLGIISLDHSDNLNDRGGPAGFWEVYFKQEATGFAIRRLKEGNESGDVLVRGRFRTKPFYLLNQAALYTRSYFYLKKVLLDISASGGFPAAQESLPSSARILKAPSLREQLAYALGLCVRAAGKIFSRFVLGRRYCWGVAYRKSGWKALEMRDGVRIKNPAGHYLADPFVISEGGRDFCFVEDFDFKRGKGCISAYGIGDTSAERLGEAIVEPFHMSFPYIFRHDSRIFMCPETSDNREIRLYECVDFPLKWKLSKVLMRDVNAVDTMLFERDGLWWMLTSIDACDSGDNSAELFIYYTDDLLSGQWLPHPKNPVMIDSSRARNAGLLSDESGLYRVAQRQGFEVYGKGFSINKILVLNRQDYRETEVRSVEPDFFAGLKGCHHLHSNGNISVFDFLERVRPGR